MEAAYVVTLKFKRERGWFYFMEDGKVMRIRLRQGTGRDNILDAFDHAETVTIQGIKEHPDWIYVVDEHGHVCALPDAKRKTIKRRRGSSAAAARAR